MLLLALMCYFISMNLTVERCYCKLTVESCAADGWPLAEATLDFCKQYNPLFLARPEWMRVATCVSAYGFLFGYALIGVTAALDLWSALSLPLALFIGAKLYAIAFYHMMESVCCPVYLTSKRARHQHESAQMLPCSRGFVWRARAVSRRSGKCFAQLSEAMVRLTRALL